MRRRLIWDESPMNDRRCFEALDWTLRDILDVLDKLFRGKTIVLGGDFRQTLPVKKGASKSEIPGLTKDERRRATNFATWLLEIGDGKVGIVKDNSEDYIGCLTRAGNIQDVGSLNKTQSKIRRLDLENLNGDVVELTLWDNMAIDFSPEEFEKMKQPVVLCCIQLSGTPTTHYYFNPDIPGLEELRDQYKQRLNLNPPLQTSKEKCSDINAEQNRNRFPLSTLLQQNPDGYRAFLTDESATALVTFFTPNVDVLTGSSCTQLVKKYGVTDSRDSPDEILSLNGRTHIFQIYYNPSCVKGRVDFYFDDILDKRLQIAGQSQIEEIPTDLLPVRTHKPLQIAGPFLIEEIPTASIGATTCTTEGQPSDTPNPVAETTTKNTKRTLFG
ncbi:DNA helicase [Tanacetum coccineum]|uniref:ATP-dependent DNA helicase n=1 Tax=Tanacetum coccineum TaxID=301880 RepID=A0ABQ4X5I5_9ASTR